MSASATVSKSYATVTMSPLARLRLALQDSYGLMLGGDVEVDETFIGGKARNMHAAKRREKITGTGGNDKEIVFGTRVTSAAAVVGFPVAPPEILDRRHKAGLERLVAALSRDVIDERRLADLLAIAAAEK